MHKIEKPPHTHFRTKKKAISRNPKVKIYQNLKKWIPWHGNHLTTHSLPENRDQNCSKCQIPQFLPQQAAILNLSVFRRGHPGFRTFFNFFFENGIKRYQVTNLSGVHVDLKLWPSIAHLYFKYMYKFGWIPIWINSQFKIPTIQPALKMHLLLSDNRFLTQIMNKKCIKLQILTRFVYQWIILKKIQCLIYIGVIFVCIKLLKPWIILFLFVC